jgi:hypothetical protein
VPQPDELADVQADRDARQQAGVATFLEQESSLILFRRQTS